METITKEQIQEATKRYAEALVADLEAKQKIDKYQVLQRKTHNEVVLAFQDLQALRRN